jgi:membrane-associated phospholipid phosphatase
MLKSETIAHQSRSSVPRTSSPHDPVFTPTESSIAGRIGARMRGHRPIVAGLAVWAVAFVVLVTVMVGLGLLLTHILIPHGVGRLDGKVSRWFFLQRTSTLDTVTRFGSDLGSTPVVLGVALVAIIVLAIGRHWRQIGFLVCALSLETTVFLTVAFLVNRERPLVPRLDATPSTSSYPSGHLAASIALYVGLAIIIWSLVRSRWIRAVAWIVAVALPVLIGIARLYRGMHHLTDVLASILLGCGVLLFALLATRSGVAAGEARRNEAVAIPHSHPSLEEAS